ncbi:MAG: hypothetical protein L0Z55_05625 [Planctomycetes bacterium]|nr:hypothetical protein [Planctomycetota bacterium]
MQLVVSTALALALAAVPLAFAVARANSRAGAADEAPRGAIRVEVFCDFSVRELFRAPERMPLLWAKFDRAVVETYRSDTASLAEIARALAASPANVERAVVCHPALLPAAAKTATPGAASGAAARALLADGTLLPALRRLADETGDPLAWVGSDTDRAWLRARILTAAPARRPAAAADFSLREHAPRIAGGGASALVGESPAARTLRLANALLAADPDTAISVWVSLGCGATRGAQDEIWRDFNAALDLMALSHPIAAFDLWLWGQDAAGETETARVRWGPEITRGAVERRTQPAREFHPLLRDVAAPGEVEEK